MTYEEHLQATRTADGVNSVEAEEARAREIASDPGAIDELARKAAHSERIAYESANRERLKAQMKVGQQSFSFDGLDLEVMVPLGDSVMVPLGEMNAERIRLRKDLRTKKHIEENRAFDNEVSFWLAAEALLPSGGTISDIR